MKQNKLWFKAKRYGWGWYPCTWQGWFIIAIYVVSFVLVFRSVDAISHSGSDTLYGMLPGIILLTLVLLIVCFIKGERPRWRWGKN